MSGAYLAHSALFTVPRRDDTEADNTDNTPTLWE